MSKKQPKPSTPSPAADTTRLVVRGERRAEPDWDVFVSALLAHALAQVESEDAEEGPS